MDLQELTSRIQQWSIDRGIAKNSGPKSQLSKTAEEIHELIFAEGEYNAAGISLLDIKDAIGDIYVTLICGLSTISKDEIDAPIFNELCSDESLRSALLLGTFAVAEATITGSVANHFEAVYGMVSILDATARFYGSTLNECVEQAYNEIKDRKGYLNEQGIFVKEQT